MSRFITTFFFVLVASLYAQASSQERPLVKMCPCSEESTRINSVALDFLGFVKGGATFKYERQILPYLRITVPVDLKLLSMAPLPEPALSIFRSLAWGAVPDASALTGVGVKLLAAGWYIEPSVSVGYAWFNYPAAMVGVPKHGFVLEPRAMVGYQAILSMGLLLNFGVGIAARFFVPTAVSSPVYFPDVAVSAGYAW